MKEGHMADKDAKSGNSIETKAVQPPRRLSEIFLAALAGAAGTAIVGVVFSSSTASFLSGIFSKSTLPRDAVLFVSSADCGGLGDGWEKFELAQGRFLVGAGDSPDGGPKYQAGLTGVGRSKIKISQQNLPKIDLSMAYGLTNIDISGKGYDMPRVIGGGDKSAKISLGGNGDEIETLPSWIALTACHKR
jgi:hypothetical protein